MSDGDAVDVLHVDDDPAFANLVATFLERDDDTMHVRTATSPDEGLEVLATADIDCIVSDYDMPGTNGLEFLDAVRETYPDLPFILYTGKGSEEVAGDAISAGVTDYLQKETGSSQYTVLGNRITNYVTQYRTRREARRTERNLSELAAQTDDVMFIFDGDWTELLFINAAYEEMWGGSIETLEDTPTSFLELIHPDDRDRARASMDRLSSGRDSQLEYRVVPPDGDPRWVQGDTKSIQDDDGTVIRIVGIVRDITDRKARELQLETIVQNLPGYVYRHGYDPEYPLQFVKGDAERVTGYTAAELEEQVVNAEEIIHPDDRGGLWSNHIEGLETTGRFDSTYRIITKDGDVRWIRDQGQLIETPVTGDHVVDGFIQDVTDEVRRDRTLRDQQTYIDDTLDALQDVFLAVTTDGELHRWNERLAAVTGYTDAELQGMAATDLVVEDHRERIAQCIDDIVTTGTAVARVDIRTADGDRRTYEIRGTRLTDPVREETVAVGIGRDVTTDPDG